RLWWWQYVQKYGAEQARVLFQHASAAIDTMRDVLAQAPMDCDKADDGWLRVAHSAQAVQALQRERETLAQVFDYQVQLLDQDQLANYGLAGDEAFGALRYGDGFSAHPLKVVYALAMLARSAGAQVHTGSPVIGMCRHGDQHIFQTTQVQVRANHLLIANNGNFTEQLHSLLKSRLMPVLSSIV